MGHFTVLYLNMSEAQRAELNKGGWGSSIGKAYLNAQDGIKITDALELNLYEKATEINSNEINDLEDVFSVMQNGYEYWTARFQPLTEFPRSMSVGDIVYDHKADAFFQVANVGFTPIIKTRKLAQLI